MRKRVSDKKGDSQNLIRSFRFSPLLFKKWSICHSLFWHALSEWQKGKTQKKLIKWSFSRYFGGLWETGVKSLKYHLKRINGESTLTFDLVTMTKISIFFLFEKFGLYVIRDFGISLIWLKGWIINREWQKNIVVFRSFCYICLLHDKRANDNFALFIIRSFSMYIDQWLIRQKVKKIECLKSLY